MSEICIKPVEATEMLFTALERLGIIARICPGHDLIALNEGESDYKEVYHTKLEFGPHKLIAVTVNNCQPIKFVYHSDREDFLLLDRVDSETLILTISKITCQELEQKIDNKEVTSDDFVAIRCKKNDPFLSFFTMNPYYAHTETCASESQEPPSFYVTEPLNIDEHEIDFKEFKLHVEV